MRKSMAGAVTASLLFASLAACAENGGSAGGDGGKTVTIGVVAPLAGVGALPATEYGVNAARSYINEELGGIGGRKVEFEWCKSDGTPEFIVNCANEFVRKGVPAVYDASNLALPAAVPILNQAGIPIIGSYPSAVGVDNQPRGSAFYLSGGAPMHAAGTVQLMERSGAKKVSLAVIASAQARDYVDKTLKPSAKALGVDVTAQLVETDNINARVLAATLLQGRPDTAGVISLPEEDCQNLFEALRDHGFTGTLMAGPCVMPFINDKRPDAAGALLQSRVWLPAAKPHAPAETRKQLDAYEAQMKKLGHEKAVNEPYTAAAFGGLVTLASALETVEGDIDSATVVETLKQLKDHPTWLLGPATCDGEQWPGSASTCSRSEMFLEVQKDGSLKPLSNEGFEEVTQPTS
ncbi:ABC transporter substrate-binding protein [Streptomyces hirsutus]|uniref:ABC transporter substrate-binding protein n=1 Tax=Streptomyces hirsutus TaxID=35620 RepID=UPI0034123944